MVIFSEITEKECVKNR